MPFVVRSDSENEAELVFLSPEEEIRPPKNDPPDQGASPVLRRSNRKRKSVTAYSDNDMSKGSGTMKKKCSPPKQTPPKENPEESMPKLPRTPQAGPTAGQDPGKGQAETARPQAQEQTQA